MITFKIDVLKALADKGYTSNILRKDSIIAESVITDIRRNRDHGEPLRMNIKVINIICELLKMQPGQLLKYVPDGQNIPGGQDQKQNK